VSFTIASGRATLRKSQFYLLLSVMVARGKPLNQKKQKIIVATRRCADQYEGQRFATF